MEKDQQILVLEYIAGGDLFDLYQKQSATEKQAAKCLHGVTLAVQYCHDQGIIHGDIKSENLLYDKDIIKLCDFSTSKYIKEVENKKDLIFGTINNLAPEMILHQGINKEIDLWGLGVLCYELLFGEAPFDGDNDQEIANEIVNVNYSFPESISPHAKHLIENLLLLDPKARIETSAILTHPWIKNNI